MGGMFDYAKEFNSLDLNAVIQDLDVLTVLVGVSLEARSP